MRCKERTLKEKLDYILFVFFICCSAASFAQQDFSAVEVKPHKVTENIYMLTGAGGNIGVFTGKDGVFMVDDQYAPLSKKIQSVLHKLSDKPLRFVINTHWHGDHTGGNENMGKVGALIVAHDNVRKRMSSKQFMQAFGTEVPAAPPSALPIVTFTDATTFYWNDDEVHVKHVAPAHTDGDSIVIFKKGNVIHMGDTFFNGSYPFIDLSSGGSIDGLISSAKQVLVIADDQTKIIPGHGPLASKKDLQRYCDLLVKLRARIKGLMDAGDSKEQVIAKKPTRKFDAQYGQGFMTPDLWTGIVYDSLSQARTHQH
ncbi:MAG: MBL fold metallo-hydrolase [Gammaproteobacteria bacterium]|nr:MBL fold metallo-hydrolase [Gammaproteobacteria bacterium]